MLTLLCQLEAIVRSSGLLGETVHDRKILLGLLNAIITAREEYAVYAEESFGNGDSDYAG
jgi:hypothetical protein